MHEVDMTKCLLISLNEWRDRREDTSAMVETVHLDVGRFTCVEPDQLVTTYNAAVQGTWLDGSRLTITEIPFVGRCLICNGTYDPVPETPTALPAAITRLRRSSAVGNCASAASITAAMPPLPLIPLQSSVSAETNTPSLLPCICLLRTHSASICLPPTPIRPNTTTRISKAGICFAST